MAFSHDKDTPFPKDVNGPNAKHGKTKSDWLAFQDDYQ